MNVFAKLSRWWNDVEQQRIERHCKLQSNSASVKGRSSRSEVLQIFRGRNGEILRVRIGSWRMIATNATRRIADVRRMEGCQRVAVRVELAAPLSMSPVTTVWELYDLEGRLVSMLQSTDDSNLWLSAQCQTNNQSEPGRHFGGESSFALPAWTTAEAAS